MLNISKERIHARSLDGNFLGDPSERDIIIVEHNSKDSTPVLIGLAGFYGTTQSFLNRSFTSQDFLGMLEKMAERDSINSFIIALPDTMTSLGGNQYLNSDAVGNYEDFIVRDVIGFLRERYGKRNLGIFGKSSGGFGSYTLSVRHPDLFQGFVDVSGDAGFEYSYLRDFPSAISALRERGLSGFLKYHREKESHTSSDLNANSAIAMAAFYSPNIAAERRIDLPFDIETGRIREKTWSRWLEFDPLRNIESYFDSLTDMKVILQTGKKDEFSINIGIEGMSRILSSNGVKHDFSEYDEGHFGIDYLYGKSIPSLLEFLG